MNQEKPFDLRLYAASFLAAILLLCLGPATAFANSGSAAFVGGSYMIQPNADGSTARLSLAGIQNTTSNFTSGSLGFELWYSQNPYAGGTIQGYQVAVGYLPIGGCTSSQLPPGGSCTGIGYTAQLNQPPPGTYYPVLLLVEYSNNCTSSSGYCIDDFVNLMNLTTGGPTVVVGGGSTGGTSGGGSGGTTGGTPGGGSGGGSGGGGSGSGSIQIGGNYSYTLDFSGGSGELRIDRLSNTSTTTTSGSLRLELWATSAPYSGGSINGYRVLLYKITGSTNGQLPPTASFTNVDSGQVPISVLPPAGSYYSTLVISEFNPSACPSNGDGFCLKTYGNFSAPLQVPNAAPAPAPVPTDPLSSLTGGGAFDPSWLACLAGLFGLRRSRMRKAW